MQISKKKLFAIVIVSILAISMCGSLISDNTATAHSPPWTITPVAYTYAAPSPCGVGQSALIYGWLNYVINGALAPNDNRFENYKFIITAPDGTQDIYDFPKVLDTTSAQALSYAPEQVGTYNITFPIPRTNFRLRRRIPTATITHQPTQHTNGLFKKNQSLVLPQNPLPSEYWARPINQNQNINNALTIGSNWLGGAAQSSGLTVITTKLHPIQRRSSSNFTRNVDKTNRIRRCYSAAQYQNQH